MTYIVAQPTASTAIAPKRREGDGGFDIFSPTEQIIPGRSPHATMKWSSQIRFQMPEGWHLLALQKSRHIGLIEVHAPLIDSSYRGEVHFAIRNLDVTDYHVKRGEAMMQLLPVFSPFMELVWENRPEAQLDMTERGDGGFGSTEQT